MFLALWQGHADALSALHGEASAGHPSCCRRVGQAVRIVSKSDRNGKYLYAPWQSKFEPYSYANDGTGFRLQKAQVPEKDKIALR